MNVVKSLQERIADRLTETKNPCKTYSTEEKAEKVGAEFSKKLGNYFDTTGRPSRYVTVYITELDRWTVAFDFSELFARNTACGGYVGVASDAGFYSY
jgi:hypothetical protein